MSDNSTVELTKIKTGRKSEFKVVGEDVIPWSKKAAESKSFLRLNISGRREISLLKRNVEMYPYLIGFQEVNDPPANVYIKAWEVLKERGIPVVPTVRKVGYSEVAVTNLKANGLSVYDVKLDQEFGREKLPTDAFFVNIPGEDLEKRTQDLLKVADAGGVQIPYDGMCHLIMDKNGQWDLVMLDISNARIYKEPSQMGADDRAKNAEYAKKWVESARVTQDRIRTQSVITAADFDLIS